MNYFIGFLKECDVRAVTWDNFMYPCPNINMPGYSLRPLMKCIYSIEYYHLVESALEPDSDAVLIQRYCVWLRSPIVFMSGIWI